MDSWGSKVFARIATVIVLGSGLLVILLVMIGILVHLWRWLF